MSVWQTQSRLLSERLGGLLHGDLSDVTDDDVARLVCAAYVLLDEHRVDKRGRCRHCHHRSCRWGLRRPRTCTVHAALAIAMHQPLGVVWQWVGDRRHRAAP